MRLGVTLAAFLVVSGSAFASGRQADDGAGRNLCSVWHRSSEAPSSQPTLRPQYLVSSQCGRAARATPTADTSPQSQPWRAFPGIHRKNPTVR